MGCFDSNCCITGLPLHHYDKVRAAIITPYQPEQHSCYIGSAFQFWTMPVSSTYNDYGNLEWGDIEDEHKWGLEYILKLTLPGMKDHEEYSRKVFENNKKLSLNELWDNMFRGQIDLDPDRDLRNAFKKWQEDGCVEEDRPVGMFASDPMSFRAWMCHEWAYQEVLNLEPVNKSILEHADNYCYTHDDFDAEMEGVNRGDDATDEEIEQFHEAFFKYSNSNKHWVEGDQGGIAQDVRRIIQSGVGRGVRPIDQTEFTANRDAFKQRLIETAQFCHNLFLIRTILMPMTTFGTQYDEWDIFPKWTALVASKAEEKRQQREDEGF